MKFVLLIGLIFLVFTPLLKAAESCKTDPALGSNDGYYNSPSHTTCVKPAAGCALGFSYTKATTPSTLTGDCDFCAAASSPNALSAIPGDPLMTYTCVADNQCSHRFVQASTGLDCLQCKSPITGTNCETCSGTQIFDRPYQFASSACVADATSCLEGYTKGGSDTHCQSCDALYAFDRKLPNPLAMCIKRADGNCDSGNKWDRIQTMSTSSCVAASDPCHTGYKNSGDVATGNCDACIPATHTLNKDTAGTECVARVGGSCASGTHKWNKIQTLSDSKCILKANPCEMGYDGDNCENCATGYVKNKNSGTDAICISKSTGTCAANFFFDRIITADGLECGSACNLAYKQADPKSNCDKCADTNRLDRLATAEGAKCVAKGTGGSCQADYVSDTDNDDCNKCASGKQVDRPAKLAGAMCAQECHTPYTGANCDECKTNYVWNAPKVAMKAMCVMKSDGACMEGYTDNGAGKAATDATISGKELAKDCFDCAEETKELDAATGACKVKATDTSKDTDKSTSGDSKTNSAILGFVISTMALLLAIFI